jgi:hypothetical protein
MTGSENATHLEYQSKSALKKLLYDMLLKVCLQTVEGEISQIHTQLFEVN